MLKDAVINIHSVQGYGLDEEDHMDFTTDGFYSYIDGVGCLSYMETEVTGLEGTRTSVMVMPDQVVVDRDGTVTSRMIFREGLKNSFPYSTPYGTATLSMDTRQIRQNFNENGGSVMIDYVVDMEHAVVMRNIFTLNVREIKMGEHSYV